MQQNLDKQFEQQINTHKGIIYKVTNLYAYTDANRQDLFQEIVLQLWRAFPKFRGDAKLSTWVYRIALNTAISGLRREKKDIVSFMPDLSPYDNGEITGNNGEERKLVLLYNAIKQLNQVDKAMVMLYLEDKTYADMEDILGISQGNIRVRITRIKEKLRQLTKNDDYGT